MTKKKELPKTFKVVVTAKDIKRGKQGQSKSCPIALATKRCLRKRVEIIDTIRVFMDTGYLIDDIHYNMPDKAINFIRNFDGGEPVKPFTFIAKIEK